MSAKRSAPFEPKADESETKNGHDEETPEQIAARRIAKPAESEKKAPSLFANLNQPLSDAPKEGSFLFNNTGVPAPPFNNQAPVQNLFTGVSSLFGGATGGLFSNTSTSIFSNVDQSKSIFSHQFQQSKAESDSDDGEDAGEDPDPNKSDEEANKEIIMKFEYKTATTQVLKFPLIKFRRNDQEVLEKGSIAIEKVNDQDTHVIIYRNNIQNLMYQGVIYKGISKVGPLNQRKENLVVKTLSSDATKEGEKPANPYNVDKIKLMFEHADEAAKFETEFKKLIQG